MSKEKIFKMIYDASVLIGISSGFGYFISMNDPSDSVIDYLKWVGILSGSIYLKEYMQREEILKRIDSLNSKKGPQATTLGAIASKEKNLDLKSKRTINLANPVGDRDAVNKSYVDEKVKTLVNRKGDLDMGGDSIKNLKKAKPSDANHAANVDYVNRAVDNSESITNMRLTEIRKYVDESVPRKVFYKGYLKHNNENTVKFFANGTEDHTRYTRQSDPSDFIVNEEDYEKIIIKNPGVYSISLIDGLKTSREEDNGTVQFILNPAPFLSLSDNINITVPNTGRGWKTYNFISVLDIYKDTSLKIQTSDASTIFDGLGNGYKKFGFIILNKID